MVFKMNTLLYTSIITVVLQGSKCADREPSFWSQRRGLDFRTGDKPPAKYRVHYPSLNNIKNNKVVLINGYRLGTSMLALSTVGAKGKPNYPQLDMKSGDFYTNAYRWTLRAISLIPEWMAGSDSVYPDAHKVWRKRFYYMDDEVPQWLRNVLFFVDDWEQDKDLVKRYNLYAKPSFDKHLRYPSKVATDNFVSFRQTAETVENLDDSEAETPGPRMWGYWAEYVWDPYDEYVDNWWNRLFNVFG